MKLEMTAVEEQILHHLPAWSSAPRRKVGQFKSERVRIEHEQIPQSIPAITDRKGPSALDDGQPVEHVA